MQNSENQIFRYNGSPITFSQGDSVMINATEMAKPFPEKKYQTIASVQKDVYICNTLHFERRIDARQPAGVLHLIYEHFTASYPRAVRLMATLPLERCKVTGKVRPFFILSP